ncbi:MAG: alkaline phosphatase family protein [Bacteroidetes bacterium]|nr:MAG: alkaline phosphatase family protein [Bacteroidota bacterium]TAF95955.1 MAG: alkaline phosphatase family protein [Bacteroidota bacterium]
MKKIVLVLMACVYTLGLWAQALVQSGPMLGHTDLRSAQVWISLVPQATVTATAAADGKTVTALVTKDDNAYNNIQRVQFYNLEPGTTYQYTLQITAAKQKSTVTGSFTTQSLWQFRRPAPDFSFLAGSCTFFNEPQYDRPGKPYGGDSSIFEAMAKEKSDFMLWLGDNWYTREVDYYSVPGLHYRAAQTKALPILQNFWKAMPHYAIWDDHDYGPNDADKSYVLKETSRKVFSQYWSNPSYGFENQGIYSKFTWNDVDVFLLDDRYFRSNDDMEDSVNGMPNTEKRMFGKQQIDWLKNALLQSKTNGSIAFRIIATGSQVLNQVSPFDCFRKFPEEFNDFMNFLEQHNINGVLFLTGDRHHTEIIKQERTGKYPLYDITASPLTSGTHKFGGPEANNPYRVLGVDQLQNYAKLSFSGDKKNRKLTVQFLGIKGDLIKEWSVTAAELTTKK